MVCPWKGLGIATDCFSRETLKLEHRIQVQQVSASSAKASEAFYLTGRLVHEDESSASKDVLHHKNLHVIIADDGRS